MKKKLKQLPPVIPAPPELLEAMRRLSELPPLSFEQMKAQVDASLRQRNGSMKNNDARSSGRVRKAA